MNIIGHKYIYLTISGLLVAASIAAIGVLGVKLGIDFTGGTLWQVGFPGGAAPEVADFKRVLAEKTGLTDAVVIPESETKSIILRVKEMNEAEHVRVSEELKKTYPALEDLRFESIGSTVGGELRRRAVWAFTLVILGISFYIAFAFRKVSKPVSSWKYGAITLITLFHDALIPAGLFALLSNFFGAELDTNFVVAILVVMGFSVHDTIVVFDRIRENLRLERSFRFDFAQLVNKSVNETFARSINTSLTLVLVLLALYFFGSANLSYFVLTILVGTVVGTYSSIFVASPLLTLWNRNDYNVSNK